MYMKRVRGWRIQASGSWLLSKCLLIREVLHGNKLHVTLF